MESSSSLTAYNPNQVHVKRCEALHGLKSSTNSLYTSPSIGGMINDSSRSIQSKLTHQKGSKILQLPAADCSYLWSPAPVEDLHPKLLEAKWA